MTAQQAIAVHMQWRSTFQLHVTLREPLAQELLDRIHFEQRCQLGLWIASPLTEPIRKTPQFLELNQQHRAFHREMATLAAHINAGRYQQAERMLIPGSSYLTVSQLLAQSITAACRILEAR